MPCFAQDTHFNNIISNGHGCMLQYALLHLYGYALSMDDLKAFRVSCRELNTRLA